MKFCRLEDREKTAAAATWSNIGASCVCVCGENANAHSWGGCHEGFKVDPIRNDLRKSDLIWMEIVDDENSLDSDGDYVHPRRTDHYLVRFLSFVEDTNSFQHASNKGKADILKSKYAEARFEFERNLRKTRDRAARYEHSGYVPFEDNFPSITEWDTIVNGMDFDDIAWKINFCLDCGFEV